MKVRNTIRVCRRPLWVVGVSAGVIWMTVLTSCGLRDVWNNLHTTGNDACWSSTAGSISGCGWAAEAFCELLNQGLAHVVGRNVDSVSNTKDYKRAFGGEGKTRVRGVKARSRSFLDLTNANSRFADNGTYEDVGN